MSAPAGRFAQHLAAVPSGSDASPSYNGDLALALAHPSIETLPVLLSAAALPRLEELAQRAREVTWQRFGRAVRLFAPLYVSNACLSSCSYCGFSRDLDVARKTLTVEEVVREARTLVDRGFRHLLLVSGEHRIEVSADYLVACVEALAP